MSNIKLFESKQIRTVWNESDQKWYFVVADVVQVLTDTPNPTDYIKKMRKRDELLSLGWGQIVTPLSVETAGGKQKLNCANAQGLLRIIQSIPSPKAEPFKLWLAKVGSERLEEIENPELATQRTREIYKLKGYPDDWIEKRMRSIAIREELTDEWKSRGIKEKIEYAILTAEISTTRAGKPPVPNLFQGRTKRLKDNRQQTIHRLLILVYCLPFTVYQFSGLRIPARIPIEVLESGTVIFEVKDGPYAPLGDEDVMM